jgi:hypothetical protein
VPKQPSTEKPRCTPTSTLSTLRSIHGGPSARGALKCRRRVTDAEVATLCVAQAIVGIPSGRRFLAVATRRLLHLFPELSKQPRFHERRVRLTETIEWLIGDFAAESRGFI